MSESKHTPGPWHVHDRWYIGTVGEGIRTHAEVKCCVNVPAHDHEQHEANARLIASAPDLLAAVKELLEVRTGDGLLDPACAAFGRAQAAIRKAEGA